MATADRKKKLLALYEGPAKQPVIADRIYKLACGFMRTVESLYSDEVENPIDEGIERAAQNMACEVMLMLEGPDQDVVEAVRLYRNVQKLD